MELVSTHVRNVPGPHGFVLALIDAPPYCIYSKVPNLVERSSTSVQYHSACYCRSLRRTFSAGFELLAHPPNTKDGDGPTLPELVPDGNLLVWWLNPDHNSSLSWYCTLSSLMTLLPI